MAFTYDLSTDTGKVRLGLADTGGVAPDATATVYVFEDAELAQFLTDGGSVTGAVIEGLKVLLIDAARRAKSFSLKGLSMNDTGRIAAIKDAILLLGGLPSLTVNFPSLLPMDQDFTEITS